MSLVDPPPPDGFLFRRLDRDDDLSAYFRLLSFLTEAPLISGREFNTILDTPNKEVYVIVSESGGVAATGSLLIEPKFIHGGSLVGHIEDIVVDPQYRGTGLGRYLVTNLRSRARALGCYKVILTCKEELIPFYRGCGFDKQLVTMSTYF